MSLKVFDLVPGVNKLDHFKSGQIESFCYSNTILCIGTSDGQLFRFSINRSNSGLNSTLIDSKLLNHKKPINQITVLTELQKIIYLCDGYLTSINFNDLEPCVNSQIRIKNVTAYCFNKKCSQTNPFGLEQSLLTVCIKGRLLQLYFIDEDLSNLLLYKEINLPEICLGIQSNKNHLCLSCENGYFIVDIKNETTQKLFPYELDTFTPYMVNHVEGEFLLNCVGGLGVFATFDGQSTKPPITWMDEFKRFQIAHPYVICTDNDSIYIYNLLDSKLKQHINFKGTKELEYIEEENFFILTTPVQMYFMNALSADKQIEQLIDKHKIDEAILLFECLNKNLGSLEYDEKLKKVKTKCGFIELGTSRDYEKAEKLFLESNLDFRQIARLIPNLDVSLDDQDESSNEYKKYIQGFIESLDVLTNRDEVLTNLKYMFINFLLKTKKTKTPEFVSILFQLCIEIEPEKLADKIFFTQLPLKFCLQNTEILYDNQRHHSIGIIYHLLNKNEEAFSIWKDLCDGNLEDVYFPGFDHVIEKLSSLKDHQLLLSYLDWAMLKDQNKAVKIFTERPKDELASERLRPDLIIERLLNYKEALVIFLEFLVFNKSIMKEKYTTQLIGVYLENVIALIKQTNVTRTSDWTNDLDKARKKLQNILQSSANYRVQLILGRIKEFEKYLQKECAILYGKIEEHEKALKIFVYTLQDYTSATEYCLRNSKDSLKKRKNLFHILFTIYMNPNYIDRDKLLKPALELLDSKLISSFDIPKLLEIIPSNWSVKITSNFLMNSLQKNLALKNNYSVEKKMCANFKFSLQTITYDLRKEQLYIDDDSRCCKCHKTFESSIFIRQPNGKLSHIMCKNDLLKF